MPNYIAAWTLLLMICTVLVRAFVLRRQGIRALKFGQTDKTDFLIPPFAVLYIYVVFASAFDWPRPSRQEFFSSVAAARCGAALCIIGLTLSWWSIFSFGRSFRVGIDTAEPDHLVTTGLFAFSRNPIYVAFGLILAGVALIVPNWIVFLYLVVGVSLFHRQVIREEAHLAVHYGSAYEDYRAHVRRYF